MTNPKPKFCVGEEVALVSDVRPECNIDKVEVVKMSYSEDWECSVTGKIYSGYAYKLAHSHRLWPEPALRKLPPESRTGWEDCVWKPVKEKV